MAAPAPKPSLNQPLIIGSWPGVLNEHWYGYITQATISKIARSDKYLAGFAARFPASGIASLASVDRAASHGGGDLGLPAKITSLTVKLTEPPTTGVLYRLGSGSTPAEATADKLAQKFVALHEDNSLDKHGQFVDYDIELLRSSDRLGQQTPLVSKLAIAYEPEPAETATEPAPAPVDLDLAPAPAAAAESRQPTVFSALLALAASLLIIGKSFLF
jgi:hypothetical protein